VSDVFADLYAPGSMWGDGSGGGSDPKNAAAYVAFLHGFLAALKPATVLDIGCGDGRIAGAINWQGAHYIGIDVAQPALDLFRQWSGKMGTAGSVKLQRTDALTGKLPNADLAICKEVMQHIPNAAVWRLLCRLRAYPLVLHCSAMTHTINGDMETGWCRGVDLSLPPFSLPVDTVFQYEMFGVNYICQVWKPCSQSA